MFIANPIYDLSFKKLMENNKVAKFLLGTILKCEILSLEATSTEYTAGKSVEQISKITGLSVKEIEMILKK